MSEITAVSLFTGAGGMDIGFEHAGVSILCANEHMDELKQYRGVDLVFGGPPCQGFLVAGKWSRMTPAVS